MAATEGKIDPDVGNEIRLALVDWCATYKQPQNTFRFTNVSVRLNVQGVDPRNAVEVSSEFSGGLFDKLELQRAIFGFAAELKKRYGVTLDHLEVRSDNVWMTFLGPDGQRIPPISR